MKLKKILSVLLVFALLGPLLPTRTLAEAQMPEDTKPQITYQEYPISTLEDWDNFQKLCRLDSASVALHVTLENDLSLISRENAQIPTFGGIFDGKGHTISGFTLTCPGSVLGLFRYIQQTGTVKNLNLSLARVTPEGSCDRVGSLAGINRGTVENCKVTGVVIGQSRTGILAGTNDVTGTITGCTGSGFLRGTAMAGGIAGENLGIIKNCTNSAKINTTVDDSALTLDDFKVSLLMGTRTLSECSDIGGIAGFSSGVIRSCRNQGPVGYIHTGYNLGGIAGRQNGLIADCSNQAAIFARKEGGGIAGQMEPSNLLVYNEDTLQKLEKELTNLQFLVNNALVNMEIANTALQTDLGTIENEANIALNALNAFIAALYFGSNIEDGEDIPHLSIQDPDAVTASGNYLTCCLTNLASVSTSAASTAQQNGSVLLGNLEEITYSINNMLAILQGRDSNPLKAEDVSSEEVDSDAAGKIVRCANAGAVCADINAGGIIGSAAHENAMDPEDDFSVEGTESKNLTFRSRALVYQCKNSGIVGAEKQVCGGIVGLLTMGTVRQCESYGPVCAENAHHVGGIAGDARGSLENNYAKCTVKGSGYVGGIAGEAKVIQDSRAMVRLQNSGAFTGGIAGNTPENSNITGNLFLESDDFAGIDSISYQGLAEPVSYSALLATENIPDYFSSMHVSFTDENGAVLQEEVLPYGETLQTLPQVPEKPGYSGQWQEFGAERVLFDFTVSPVYTPLVTVIRAEKSGNTPQVLVEGAFTEAQKAVLTEKEGLWTVTVPDDGQQSHVFRVKSPSPFTLTVVDSQGRNIPAEITQDGSYQVFTAEGANVTFRLTQNHSQLPVVPVSIAAAALLALAALMLIKKGRAKRTRQSKTKA